MAKYSREQVTLFVDELCVNRSDMSTPLFNEYKNKVVDFICDIYEYVTEQYGDDESAVKKQIHKFINEDIPNQRTDPNGYVLVHFPMAIPTEVLLGFADGKLSDLIQVIFTFLYEGSFSLFMVFLTQMRQAGMVEDTTINKLMKDISSRSVSAPMSVPSPDVLDKNFSTASKVNNAAGVVLDQDLISELFNGLEVDDKNKN